MNELRALRTRVNALRRKMALPLAIVRVRRMASDYCHRWSVAQSNHELPPDPHPFIQSMVRVGIWLPSFPLPAISLTAAAVRKPRPTQNASSVSFSHGPTATRKAALSRRGNPCGCPGLQGLFILSSFPRRRESMWSCHEKFAIGHGHVGSRFRGKDETRLTQSGK